MKIRLLIFVILLLSISACLKTTETINDVVDLRQDHAAYLSDSVKVKDLLTVEAQSQLDEDYNIIYFSVWHQRQPFYALSDRVRLDFVKFEVNPGFGENKLKHSKNWLKKLKQNAFLNNYPNTGYAAITTRNTSLRLLPTQKPHFSSVQGDSASWPFDNLQRSSVAANTLNGNIEKAAFNPDPSMRDAKIQKSAPATRAAAAAARLVPLARYSH